MKSDGKQLEALVSFVEKILLPQGFDVKTNHLVFNDEGVQIAEFDIEVRGKVGSTEIAWLIECRDRPTKGAAPGSWIEQLVGRRSRFGFNKVTAVSTTGFSAGAVAFAESSGIEIREVKDLSPDEFSSWLQLREIVVSERLSKLHGGTIIIDQNEDEQLQEALNEVITSANNDACIFRSLKTGERTSLIKVFGGAVSHAGNLFDNIQPNVAGQKIELHANYDNKTDRFVVDTKLGEVHVQKIIFIGSFSITERLAHLNLTAEYRNVDDGDTISQVAAFEPIKVQGSEISLEMHKIEKTGKTHITLRKT